MPTVREKLDAGLAAGIPLTDLQARSKQLGLTKDDLDLDYDEAKRRGAERLAKATAAPIAPVPTPAAPAPVVASPALQPDQAKVAAAVENAIPIRKWFAKSTPAPTKPEPVAAPELSPEATAEESGSEERQYLAAEGLRQHPELAPNVHIELPTPGAIGDRLRGMAVGAAKGVLGDTQATRSLEAMAHTSRLHPLEVAGLAANTALEAAGIDARLPETEAQKETRKYFMAVPKAKHAVVNEREALHNVEQAMKGGRQERENKALNLESGTTTQNLSQMASNTAKSAYNLAASMIDLAGNVVGMPVVPEGQTPMQTGAKVGEEMGKQMPGQMIDLAHGLSDLDANSLVTDPFGTFMMVIDPALRSVGKIAALSPKVAAVKQAVAPAITEQAAGKIRNLFQEGTESVPLRPTQVRQGMPARETSIERAMNPEKVQTFEGPELLEAPKSLPVKQEWVEALGEKLAPVAAAAKGGAMFGAAKAQDVATYLARTLTDGLIQGDPRATAVMHDLFQRGDAAKAAINNYGEQLARQIEQGKVTPKPTGLQPVDVSIIPKADVAGGNAAAAAARRAGTEYGRVQGAADLGAIAAEEAKRTVGEVQGAQRSAQRAERQVAKSSVRIDNTVNASIPGIQKAADAAESAIYDTADAAIPLAERLASSPLPKIASQEIAATRAAKAFERAQAAYIDAAREAKVNPSEFANQFAALAAEEAGKTAEKLAGKQVPMLTTDARAYAQESQRLGRQAQPKVYKALRDFTKAQNDLAGQVGKVINDLYREGGNVAQAAMEVAERTKAIDAVTTASQARAAAGVQGGIADLFKRRAAKAELAAEEAPMLPATAAERVYVPPEFIDTNKMTLRNPEAALPGAGKSLAEQFPTADPGHIAAIEEAARKASLAQRDAVAALGNLDPETIPLNPQTAPTGAATWYEAGRAFADDQIGRNVDNLRERVAAGLVQLADTSKMTEAQINRLSGAAGKVADWLIAQDDYRGKLRMMEPGFGGIHRPTPEVMQASIDPRTGRLVGMPEARKEGAARMAPALEDIGHERRAQQALTEMKSRRLVQEAPKPVASMNDMANLAMDEIAKVVREQGYYGQELMPGQQRSVKPLDLGAEVPPDQFVAVQTESLKRLIPQRVGQRMLEVLDLDSTQLLRSEQVRLAMLKEYRTRLESLGYTGKVQLTKMLGDFMTQLRKGNRTNEYSKNRFFEIKDDATGKVLWSRQDFANTIAKVDPAALKRAQGDVARLVAQDMADAVSANQVTFGIYNETNRFRTTPKGEAIEATYGSIENYARSVMSRVLLGKELKPLMMPFEGAKVADAMTVMADEFIKTSGAAARDVDGLIDWVRGFEPATSNKALDATFAGYVQSALRGTDAPPSLVNVHMHPGVMASMAGQVTMMAASDMLGNVPNLIREIGQAGKRGVVALSTKALVNNDFGNAILNGFRRADPNMLTNLVKRPLEYKQFLDGNYRDLSPHQLRMYRAFARTTFSETTALSADIGKSRLSEAFAKAFPDAAAAMDTLNAATNGGVGAPARMVGRFQDVMAKMYNNLGDLPFRLEEMSAQYNEAHKVVNMLQPGEQMHLQTAGQRGGVPVKEWVVVKNADGTVTMTEMGAGRALRPESNTVPIDSDAFAQAVAEHSNWAQERIFFNYNNIGNAFKYLRSSVFSLLSGVFSWQAKAMDIPFIKQGLFSEMLAGPPIIRTTSPAVRAYQAGKLLDWSTRRAYVTAAARAAFTDSRQLELISKAFGWNPAVQGVVLAQASSPWYVNVRNIEPLMVIQPTLNTIGATQAALGYAAYHDLMIQPNAVAELLNWNPALARKERLEVENDRMLSPEAKAEKLAELDTNFRKQAFLRDGLLRYANGTFSTKQALSMIGLGGGPLLSILQRMQQAEAGGQPFGIKDGVREFAKQMFGSTLAEAVNVSAGGLAELGITSADEWSTHAKEETKAGRFAGGIEHANQAGYMRWAIRQMIGIGWSEVYFGDGGLENAATGKEFYGRADNYIKQARQQLISNLVAPAEQQAILAQKVAAQSPTPENTKAAADARSRYEVVKDAVDGVLSNQRDELTRQYNMIRNIKVAPKAPASVP